MLIPNAFSAMDCSNKRVSNKTLIVFFEDEWVLNLTSRDPHWRRSLGFPPPLFESIFLNQTHSACRFEKARVVVFFKIEFCIDAPQKVTRFAHLLPHHRPYETAPPPLHIVSDRRRPSGPGALGPLSAWRSRVGASLGPPHHPHMRGKPPPWRPTPLSVGCAFLPTPTKNKIPLSVPPLSPSAPLFRPSRTNLHSARTF